MNANEAYRNSDDFKISSSRPKIIVGSLIYKGKKILLGTSDKFKNKWVIFNGHLEMGQKLEDCAIHEAKEKTGLDVINPEYICFIENVGSGDFTMKKHFVFMNYCVEAISENVCLDKEMFDCRWFSFDDVLDQDLNFSTRTTIESFLKNRT